MPGFAPGPKSPPCILYQPVKADPVCYAILSLPGPGALRTAPLIGYLPMASLPALLFMRRMIEVADTRPSEDEHPELPRPLPKGVFVYDILGPLFFGAAERATAMLNDVAGRAQALILRMEHVPAIDATGLVALEGALESLARQPTLAIITGLRTQPREVLTNAGIVECERCLLVRDDIESALEAAEQHIAKAHS